MSMTDIFSSASNLNSTGSLSIVLFAVSSVISTFSVISFAFFPKFPPVSVTPMLLFSSSVLASQLLQPLQPAKIHRHNANNIPDRTQSSFFMVFSLSFCSFRLRLEIAILKIVPGYLSFSALQKDSSPPCRCVPEICLPAFLGIFTITYFWEFF